MFPTLRRLALPAAAGLTLGAGCTDLPGTAPEAGHRSEARVGAAATGRAPTATAALVRSWGGHAPPEYDGLVAVGTPDEHPGIPLYARVGFPEGFPEGQIIQTDGRVVIVFYREVSCIPDDFNLLDFFHFPGPDGPGAWGCPAYHTGTLYTEPDAPPTAFPKIIDLEGTAVPIWLVDADAFHQAAADGWLDMPELETLDRVERMAASYDEHLHARNEDHFIGIDARHDPTAPGFSFQLELAGVVTSAAKRVHLVSR